MRQCKHVPSNPFANRSACELCGESIEAGRDGLYRTDFEQELDRFLEHFKVDALPKMKESRFVIAIGGEIDPKICLEVGAAVLLDKPLILALPRGKPISANLKRIATEIVELDDPPSSANKDKIGEAIDRLMQNDNRVRRPK